MEKPHEIKDHFKVRELVHGIARALHYLHVEGTSVYVRTMAFDIMHLPYAMCKTRTMDTLYQHVKRMCEE